MGKEHKIDSCFRQKLSGRIHERDIQEIIHHIQQQETDTAIKSLYNLIFDTDKYISGNAAWILTHLDARHNKWLSPKQHELMQEAMQASDTGKRRLILTLLLKQPFDKENINSDFLEFCFKHLTSVQESIGIKALCMKLAYKQCVHFPELLKELQLTLEIMDSDFLSPGLQAVKRKILKDIQKSGKP